MQLEIKDSDVKGVVVTLKYGDQTSPWYMRLVSPEISKAGVEAGDTDLYLWYEAQESGWELVIGEDNYRTLEAAYQEQLA